MTHNELVWTAALLLFHLFVLNLSYQILAINGTSKEDVIYGSLNWITLFGRCFENSCKFKFFRKSHCLLKWHFSATVCQVTFVSDENNILCYFLRGVIDEVLDLFFYRFEARSVGDVIHGHTAMRVSVVSMRNWPKPFLAGSVPYLYFHCMLVVDAQCPSFEVYSNRTEVVIAEHVLWKPQKKRSFPRITLANQHNLIQVFKFLLCILSNPLLALLYAIPNRLNLFYGR